MAYIRIYCKNCGGKWDVYKRNIGDELAKQCPHCYKEMDAQTWERQVIPAYNMADDANRELYKDHCDKSPLFYFDVIANHIYKNGRRPN